MLREPPRPIYDQLEPLYTALAKATLRAREDPEWSYVRDRLDEFTMKLEYILETNEKMGWSLQSRIIDKVKVFDRLDERWEIINTIIKFEDEVNNLLATSKIAYNYVSKARGTGYFAALLASLLLSINASDTMNLLLASTALAMSLAALLLINSRYSIYPALIVIPLILLSVFYWPYDMLSEISVIVSTIILVVVIPLSKALSRMLQ